MAARRLRLGIQATILRLVEQVVQRPLLAEWAAQHGRIEAALGKSKRHGDKAYRDAQAVFVGFLERLRAYRVLDPACGSGNFLYLALKCLKDIEHQVNQEAEALGLECQHDVTGPQDRVIRRALRYYPNMADVTTITLKLPQSLAQALVRASQLEQISKSELVRRAVTAHLGRSQRDADPQPSLLDRAEDLVGCFSGGPKDLASNPRHLEGFGKV